MQRKSIKLAVYVDLDPVPGTFDSAESAQNVVRGILNSRIPHYNPIVMIESEDVDRELVPLKIKSVSFQDSENRYGNKEAVATLEDGTQAVAFAWFDDELTFRPEELVGLTIERARDLKQERDIRYLRS